MTSVLASLNFDFLRVSEAVLDWRRSGVRGDGRVFSGS